MRIGIPLLNGRVAPRCNIADGLLLVTLRRGQVDRNRIVPPEGHSWQEFLSQISAQAVDTLVCGGISRDGKEGLLARGITVIENVACTREEVMAALAAGCLRPGFGFDPEGVDIGGHGNPNPTNSKVHPSVPGRQDIDCLACRERVCLLGQKCRPLAGRAHGSEEPDTSAMLESAQDITLEGERTLCRLSELIYFGLEMNYKRIGVAYCVDLNEPARILVGVLRRFFEVIPVCCKIGGELVPEPGLSASGAGSPAIACNPLGQAEMLNSMSPDLNVVVGLCVGVDSVFAQASEAPVTTLFVKDKSLANNPIGALYSDYYLKEAATPPVVRA